MSIGTDRVRLVFNPSGDDAVTLIKTSAAALIDAVDGVSSDEGEVKRLKALAMTAAEEAAMWAVKAATYEAHN